MWAMLDFISNLCWLKYQTQTELTSINIYLYFLLFIPNMYALDPRTHCNNDIERIFLLVINFVKLESLTNFTKYLSIGLSE